MRPFFLREDFQRNACIVSVLGFIALAGFRISTSHSGSKLSDASVLQRILPFTATSADQLPTAHNASTESDLGIAEVPTHLKWLYSHPEKPMAQRQRSLHIIRRLSYYNGPIRGRSRCSQIAVSLIGIIGMFSAVIGALMGPMLADTGDDAADDDRFAFWVREEDEDAGDSRVSGSAREKKYAPYRILETI